MTMTTDLTPLLKRLQLGPMAATLPERIALARREQLDYASFLEIILSDEVNRRAHRRIEMRLHQAGFQETCRLEDFDWSAAITLDRRLLDAAFSLEFLHKHEHVLLVGPAGVGKSFLAQALGYSAVRAGHTVRFIHADDYFRAMSQARVDNSLGRTFRTFLSPDLLILDDLGLHRFTGQQSADLYESHSQARTAGSWRSKLATPPPTGCSACCTTTGGKRTWFVMISGTTWWSIWAMPTESWWWTRLDFSRRATSPSGCSVSTAARRGGSRTVRLGCSWLTSEPGAGRCWTGSCTCPRCGLMTGSGGGRPGSRRTRYFGPSRNWRS